MNQSLHIFTPREATILLGVCMLLGLLASMLLQGALDKVEHSAGWENLVVLVGELLILLPAMLLLKHRGIASTGIMPLRSVSPITYLMAALLIVGVLGLIFVFESVIIPFFPIPDFLKQLELELGSGSWWATFILIVAATLVAPLVEETLFRGMLQQSLFYHYGSIIPAMIIPTLVFAMFHVAYLFYLPAMIELLALALLLSWLMLKTGNLLVTILAHALFNLSSFLSVYEFDPEGLGGFSTMGWIGILVSTLLFLMAMFYFKNLPIAQVEEVFLIKPVLHFGFPDDQ